MSNQLKKQTKKYEKRIDGIEDDNLRVAAEGLKHSRISTPKRATTSRRSQTSPTKSPGEPKRAKRIILSPKLMPGSKKVNAKKHSPAKSFHFKKQVNKNIKRSKRLAKSKKKLVESDKNDSAGETTETEAKSCDMGHNEYEVSYSDEWNKKYLDDKGSLCGAKCRLCKIGNMGKQKRVCLHQLCFVQLMFVLDRINAYVNNHCVVNDIILSRLTQEKQDLNIRGSVTVKKLSILNNQVICNKFIFMVTILLKPTYVIDPIIK